MRGADGWHGVRLQSHMAGADPDAPRRRVMIPVGWGEAAASGFAALAPPGDDGRGRALRLPEAAARWIAPLDRLAREHDRASRLGETLHAMLLRREGCPDRALWRGRAAPDADATGRADPPDDAVEAGEPAGFVLNLGAFADPAEGFDEFRLAAAVSAATLALSLSGIADPCLRIAGLDRMLAALGLDYDGEPARRFAAAVVGGARREVAALDRGVRLVAGRAGAAEALLGVETAGFAPPFDLLAPSGGLSEASAVRLAQAGIAPERALAMALDGRPPLALPPRAAHAAMHDAIAPLLDAAPPRPLAPVAARPGPAPIAPPAPAAPVPPDAAADAPVLRGLPTRRRGFTQRVSIGGQRLYLRTGQYEDGRLGEIALAMPGRGDGSLKGLLDAVSASVSLGLQHGVPLERFVALFAGGRFGCHGTVEGDPSIQEAGSPLDYVFRALSEVYLGRHLADPPSGRAQPGRSDRDTPLLPFDEIDEVEPRPRQRALRLVHAS